MGVGRWEVVGVARGGAGEWSGFVHNFYISNRIRATVVYNERMKLYETDDGGFFPSIEAAQEACELGVIESNLQETDSVSFSW